MLNQATLRARSQNKRIPPGQSLVNKNVIAKRKYHILLQPEFILSASLLSGETFQLTNFNYRAYWENTKIAFRIISEKEISIYQG